MSRQHRPTKGTEGETRWNWAHYFSTLVPSLILIWLLFNRLPVWWNQYQLEGTQAPSAFLTNVDGFEVPFPPVPGKRQIIIFWASWCGPCKVELRRFQSALDAGDLPAGSVQTIAVWDEPANVKASMAEGGYTFPVYFSRDPELLKKLQVHATPTVIHLDEKQKIHWATSGISPTGIMRAENFLGH